MSRVLLVEDDEKLAEQVLGQLRGAGLEVDWIADGLEAMTTDPRKYGLWILDLMLPNAYGLDILKHLRASSDVPVLLLSAQNDTKIKVRALELGGDDYMTKPFWPDELLARVQARLRRPDAVHEDRLEYEGVVLDLAARRLTVEGTPVETTRVEFDLLALFVRRHGAAIERQWLVDRVLDPNRDGNERTLDVHISRLRKKLGRYGKCIVTVWGVGYRFEGEGA